MKGTVIDMKKKYEIPEIDVSALITENFLCYSYDEGGGDNFISWDPFAWYRKEFSDKKIFPTQKGNILKQNNKKDVFRLKRETSENETTNTAAAAFRRGGILYCVCNSLLGPLCVKGAGAVGDWGIGRDAPTGKYLTK